MKRRLQKKAHLDRSVSRRAHATCREHLAVPIDGVLLHDNLPWLAGTEDGLLILPNVSAPLKPTDSSKNLTGHIAPKKGSQRRLRPGDERDD